MRNPICLFSGRVAACYAPGVITRRPSSVVLQALALPAGFPLASSTTATTNASGVAQKAIPGKYVNTQPRQLRAVFAGDAGFLGATANAQVYQIR